MLLMSEVDRWANQFPLHVYIDQTTHLIRIKSSIDHLSTQTKRPKPPKEYIFCVVAIADRYIFIIYFD